MTKFFVEVHDRTVWAAYSTVEEAFDSPRWGEPCFIEVWAKSPESAMGFVENLLRPEDS